MYVSRLIIVSLLVLVVFTAACSQGTGKGLDRAWEDARPAVLGLMDHAYALIRNLVAGSDAEDSMDDNAPGVDFDLITTMDSKNPF
jgi:hypothetical protein